MRGLERPTRSVDDSRMTNPASSNSALAARDLRHLWHPCTQMHDHDIINGAVPMIPIVRGEGAWLIDADGRRYLDGISSWWTNLFGHANPRINAAFDLSGDGKTVVKAGWSAFSHQNFVEDMIPLDASTPGTAMVSTVSPSAIRFG